MIVFRAASAGYVVLEVRDGGGETYLGFMSAGGVFKPSETRSGPLPLEEIRLEFDSYRRTVLSGWEGRACLLADEIHRLVDMMEPGEIAVPPLAAQHMAHAMRRALHVLESRERAAVAG